MLINKNKLPIKEIVFLGLFPSFIKKVIYRLMGYRIGKNVSIGLGSVIIGKDVEINDNVKIGFLTLVKCKRIKIGRYVTIGSFVYIDTEDLEIGEDSEIREYVYVAGLKTPESKLKLGKRCGIFQYSFLNPTKPIILGNDCGIGGCCKLFTHGSYLSKLEGYPVAFAPITLGDNVWIPWDVFILPGVTIGNDVVVGAGSIINRNIPSNCIAAGNPAKVVVDKFPLPVSKQEKDSILKEIFSEFKNHIEHNNFTVSTNELENGFSIICKKRKNHQLIFLDNYSAIQESDNDYVLILNDDTKIEDIYKNKGINMIISIPRKERIGKSHIGEEFYRFMSRYGIRCNRLD